MISGLLNKLFRWKTNRSSEKELLPFYREDDYCQVEIVPRKNIEHIKKSLKQIREFAKKTYDGYGFTDIFMRDDLPCPLKDIELRIDHFEQTLEEKGFEQVEQICYEFDTIVNCSKSGTSALSNRYLNIFYECEGEFVDNIWLKTSLIASTEAFNNIIEVLYELGEASELVLVDWNSTELIDLTDRNQIKNYFMKYWK